mmetsp:Transcript_55267/g.140135  ORF Transcript_55267/g.140135 Transcript_55267/m.140135 type:complete len:215 (+) Transcript_55267:68-712(+)
MPSEAAAALLETATLEALAAAAAEAAATAARLVTAGATIGSGEAGTGEEGAAAVVEAPPEDLELREQLDAFTKARGHPAALTELGNAAKILRRLSQDTSNAKLHEMRCDVLDRMVGEALFFAFLSAGFEEQSLVPTGSALRWRGDTERLQIVLHEVQRAGDLCLDPDCVSFATVTELVKQNRTLPGIENVDDKVATPVPAKDSSMERPKKPWEQ